MIEGPHRREKLMRRLAHFQSIYYFIFAVWPLISMRTFEAVTGNKTDEWLVVSVSLLLLSTAPRWEFHPIKENFMDRLFMSRFLMLSRSRESISTIL